MTDIGVVFTSRNNYEFMYGYTLPYLHRHPHGTVLNIDEESDKAQRMRGVAVCNDHDVIFQNCSERGMQFNIAQASQFFLERGQNFFLYAHHDCFFLEDDFFPRLRRVIDSGALQQFATIGFNALATDVVRNRSIQLDQLMAGGRPIGLLGRTPLDRYAKWCSGVRNKKIKALKYPELFRQPFSVQTVAWFAVLVNAEKYLKHVVPSKSYQFFHAWDDISFQLLQQNIHNLVLPNFYVEHRPDLKPSAGLPLKSAAHAKKGDTHFYGHYAHLQAWRDRWGWEYEDRNTFDVVYDRYNGTLLTKFFDHDTNKGPLVSFDIDER